MINPTNKDLRIFSIILAVGVILVQRIFAGYWVSTLTWCMLGFAAVGIVLPFFMKYPFIIWLKVGGVIGAINIRIILMLTYYLMFTPLAIWFKIIGRDKLKLKKTNCESYWEDYDSCPKTIERYRKLF